MQEMNFDLSKFATFVSCLFFLRSACCQSSLHSLFVGLLILVYTPTCALQMVFSLPSVFIHLFIEDDP
jgi:hypothetical protein